MESSTKTIRKNYTVIPVPTNINAQNSFEEVFGGTIGSERYCYMTVVIDGRGHLVGSHRPLWETQPPDTKSSTWRKRDNVNPALGTIKDLLRGCQRYDSTQNKAWTSWSRSFAGVRRCCTTYDKKHRVYVPTAIKILTLCSNRKFCKIGPLPHVVVWQY